MEFDYLVDAAVCGHDLKGDAVTEVVAVGTSVDVVEEGAVPGVRTQH